MLERYNYKHDWIRLGDLGGFTVKISGKYFELDENGSLMVAQGVWENQPSLSNYVEEPLLFDIIAWHPSQPYKWFYLRGETGLILGEKSLFEAQIFGMPLYVYETPLEWLKAGMKGIVLLDFYSLHCLIGIEQVVFTNPHFGQKIKNRLTAFIYKGFPKFCIDQKGQQS